MKLIVLVTAVLTVVGCTHSRQIRTAEGAEGHFVNCSGYRKGWGHCDITASELCGARGWTVLKRNQSEGFAGGAENLHSTQTRTMVIQCK